MKSNCVFVLDMGGTNIKGAVINNEHEIVNEIIQVPADSNGEYETIKGQFAKIFNLLKKIAIDNNLEQNGMIVSSPGPVDFKNGIPLMTHKYTAIYGKNLKELFGSNFVWVDHHKPIIEASVKEKFDDVHGWRDSSRSAILNAYRYLYDPLDEKYQSHTEPFLLRILSAYDSWTYDREKIKFEKARNVNKGVTSYFDLDIELVSTFVDSLLYGGVDEKKYIPKFEKLGKQLNAYDDSLAKAQIRDYGDFEWTVNGRPAVMIMFQGPSGSQMFKTLQGTEIKNGIVLKYLPTGKWNISLYNIDRAGDTEFHCGNYLKNTYGGGGHAGAGGAVLTENQYKKMMKNKAV